MLFGDPANLLGNAIKFTSHGEVRLHVTLDRRRDNRLWLSASVQDTGPGLTDQEQKKLFEPFSQAKRGLEAHGGTGLGLAITRQYARLMGGDVTLSSIPGLKLGVSDRLELALYAIHNGLHVGTSTKRAPVGGEPESHRQEGNGETARI